MPARKKTTSTTRKKTTSKKVSKTTVKANLPPPQDPELLKKIELCESACQSLLSSRNKLILITLISWLIILVLIFYLSSRTQPIHIQPGNSVPPSDSRDSIHCEPQQATGENSSEDPVAYIRKIRRLLEEDAGNETTEQDTRHTISTVLDLQSDDKTGSGAASEQDKQEIIDFIYQWALAWELKNVDEYFSYYSGQFDPGSKADNLDGWKTLKRYYIRKPEWIKIKIDQIEVTRFKPVSTTVTFSQSYEIPTYADITQKTLVLRKEKDGWKIVRESGVIQHVDLKNQG